MAKVYIAGRVGRGEGDISELAEDLEGKGHEITLKWWELAKLKKPFLVHRDQSQVVAINMVKAVKKSDVLILFAEDNILGAATELGIVIGDTTRKREIIIIHPTDTRQSVFYTHPFVTILQNVDDIKKRPWY